MSRQTKSIVSIALVIFLALTMLPGCTEEEKPHSPIGSDVWETMPKLTYGVMEYDKLQILPWNNGRCEATSYNTMAETDNGYYMARFSSAYAAYRLYYADKTDLSLWVPVCAAPNCDHNRDDCSAFMQYEQFVARDGKIYYQLTIDGTQYDTGNCWYGLMSMSEAGGDITVVQSLSDLPPTLASAMTLLTSQHWLYNVHEIDAQGNYTAYSYRLTDAGWEDVAKVEYFEDTVQLRTAKYDLLHGDPVFQNGVLGMKSGIYYLYRGDELVQVDLTGLTINGSYLSGDILRFFRINDGYYDLNIKTGEEVRLADAQLENSYASIMIPNCIIESTLITYLMEDNNKNLPEGTEHALRLFDGKTWREVELPNDLRTANNSTYLWPLSVTSDSIIFFSKNMADIMNLSATHYYILDLTADELKIEFVMTVR